MSIRHCDVRRAAAKPGSGDHTLLHMGTASPIGGEMPLASSVLTHKRVTSPLGKQQYQTERRSHHITSSGAFEANGEVQTVSPSLFAAKMGGG